MRQSAPLPTIVFHVRSTMLWRESRWSCECSYVSSHWTIRLYHDDILRLRAEWVVDTVTDMLRIAQRWREAVQSDDGGVQALTMLPTTRDRRQNRAERRAVTRNGRRRTDPSPDWRLRDGHL